MSDKHNDSAVTIVEYTGGVAAGAGLGAALGTAGIGVGAPAIMPVILGGSIIATSAVLPFAVVGAGAGILAVGASRFIRRLFTSKPQAATAETEKETT